ncbi:MAG: hypothetical protein RLZZ396_2576 [Planctomycetota bacterium]
MSWAYMTASRGPLHVPYGTFDRRVREAVPGIYCLDRQCPALPIISRTMEGQRTAQRTLERLATFTASRYVPRSRLHRQTCKSNGASRCRGLS